MWIQGFLSLDLHIVIGGSVAEEGGGGVGLSTNEQTLKFKVL